MCIHTVCFCREIKKTTIITLSIGTDRLLQRVDPDQMLQNAASDQGLHCLPHIQQYFRHIEVVNCTSSNFRTSMVRSEVSQYLG